MIASYNREVVDRRRTEIMLREVLAREQGLLHQNTELVSFSASERMRHFTSRDSPGESARSWI